MRSVLVLVVLLVVGCGDKAEELISTLESKKELLDSSIKKVKELAPDLDIADYKSKLQALKNKIDQADYSKAVEVAKNLDQYIFKDGTFSNCIDVIRIRMESGLDAANKRVKELIESAKENKHAVEAYEFIQSEIPNIERKEVAYILSILTYIYFEGMISHHAIIPASYMYKISAYILGVELPEDDLKLKFSDESEQK